MLILKLWLNKRQEHYSHTASRFPGRFFYFRENLTGAFPADFHESNRMIPGIFTYPGFLLIYLAISQEKIRYFVLSLVFFTVSQVLNVSCTMLNVHRLLFTVSTYYF